VTSNPESTDLLPYLNLKLALLGQPSHPQNDKLLELIHPVLRNFESKEHLLKNHLCPADRRIQNFLEHYLADAGDPTPKLPSGTLVLDRPGLARLLSLPHDGNTFSSPCLTSYRVAQGVLHNPASDRRTTKNVFHIVEGGYPIPADKAAVPKLAFSRLLHAALNAPSAMLTLPFTSSQPQPSELFVSLLLRPIVRPAGGNDPQKTMEIRFFAPGSLVSNLDFVEGIFGNAGDPQLPENDAALDVLHWTGHTGCVILAPHLVGIQKKTLGLPHRSQATPRQIKDGMCWEKDDELYNGGNAFKICCRDHHGVMVTVIADNYYGYCKKEVKTQISFAANLYGMAEEEHAGGAIAFASYSLDQEYIAANDANAKKTTMAQALDLLAGRAAPQPEGHAIDRLYPSVVYVPENAEFRLQTGFVTWQSAGTEQRLSLRPECAYILPSGFRLHLNKRPYGNGWRLIGVRPKPTVCHKPCTVSGGGKSEISKSINGFLLSGPTFVRDFHADIAAVAGILKMDFSDIFRHREPDARSRRPILSAERSLGSVIRLLTPSPDYKPAHNQWLRELKQTTRQLVFTLKRHYRPEWGGDWASHFSVDHINGFPGHELKLHHERLTSVYLRVGFDPEGSWRIFKLRPDFYPAMKIQIEDDITASVVLPRQQLSGLDPETSQPSVKLLENCETLLFQRPDDAIHRGADAQAEADLASAGTFITNFEPLTPDQVRAMVEHVADFDRFTAPMQKLLADFSANGKAGEYAVSSANPRLVNGKPTQNPRYLQKRPDQATPRETYIGEIVTRLERGIPSESPVHFAVDAVLAGRRNNPADPSVRLPALAVYGPIHYQELPELFMEFISSLTGKSPSTTGFGSEGALTKGPFNALSPIVDCNNALVSLILTGHSGFTTSAGCVGPKVRVDHDISLLVPEIWCRMAPEEREPAFLLSNGLLEKLEDFAWNGRTILASRLGYRITGLFAERFLGRVFEVPDSVFPETILRPELQDPAAFAEGMEAIVESQRRVALNYFEDGGIEHACPPLKALLHIMAHGHYEGKGIGDDAIRGLFTRASLLESPWYQARLQAKQQAEIALWQRHIASLQDFIAQGGKGIDTHALLAEALRQQARRGSPDYLQELTGTLGTDPSHAATPVSSLT
jgi:phosphoenolpyruvate carboxykinase (diphosphate)